MLENKVIFLYNLNEISWITSFLKIIFLSFIYYYNCIYILLLYNNNIIIIMYQERCLKFHKALA